MGSASTIWKGIRPALERVFEVITVDLPGHGQTPYDPGQAMDPASLADLVVANMDSLDIQKAHISIFIFEDYYLTKCFLPR